MTFALIDIGSNTIRLSVYARTDGHDGIAGASASGLSARDDLGSFTRLFSKKVMAQLASYVDDANRLTEEGIRSACDALALLGSITRRLGIEDVHAFATASLRNVANGAQALERIQRESGLAIEVLSGREEALLGFSSFQHEHPVDAGVVVDIGGGSAEVVCFEQSRALCAASMPLGSLKLYKRDVDGLLPTKKECRRIRRHVEGALDAAGLPEAATYERVCAIGGTARAVAKLMAYRGVGGERGTRFAAEELAALLEELACDERAARELILRVCPERIHTLVPGTLELDTIAKRFAARTILVGTYGVREGYVYERII